MLTAEENDLLCRVEGAAAWDGSPAQSLLRWYLARGAKKPDDTVRTSLP